MLGWLLPTKATAQNGCGLDYADLWRAVAQDTPSETHFFTDVTFSCDDGTLISADSAIVSPPRQLSQWFGNVSFNEEGRELKADRATYRSDIDRLDAFGNVSLVDTTGSELEGDNLVYIREGDGTQPTQLTMTGLGGRQPRARIVPGESEPSAAPDSTGSEDLGLADSAGVEVADAADSSATATVPEEPLDADSLPADSVANEAADTAAPPSLERESRTTEPYVVTADRIIIEGNNTFRGEGNVDVTRESLHATGRNMVYDGELGELLMVGEARSEGEGYDLAAESITVVLPDDEVEAVVARGEAELTTDDLDLTAPKIHLFVDEDALQRLVAAQLGPDDGPIATAQPTPPPGSGAPEAPDLRATALTQDFLLLGDSLDVETPGEVLERVVAVGRARGESFAGDSLNQPDTPEVAQHDWLEGDTIVATFIETLADAAPPVVSDSLVAAGAPQADSTNPLAGFQAQPDQSDEGEGEAPSDRFTLESLVASGNAKSLYRMSPSDTTGLVEPGRLALHYVVGAGITITMVDGEVDRMEVSGQTQGFHLEPLAAAPVVADTLGADTLATDTLGVDTLGTGLQGVDGARGAGTAADTADTSGGDTVAVDTLAPAGQVGEGSRDGEAGTAMGKSVDSGVVKVPPSLLRTDPFTWIDANPAQTPQRRRSVPWSKR